MSITIIPAILSTLMAATLTRVSIAGTSRGNLVALQVLLVDRLRVDP